MPMLGAQRKNPEALPPRGLMYLRELDLNQRPSGYEPDELPDCSTPQRMNGVLSPLGDAVNENHPTS